MAKNVAPYWLGEKYFYVPLESAMEIDPPQRMFGKLVALPCFIFRRNYTDMTTADVTAIDCQLQC